MENLLQNVIIGCSVLANTPMGLLRKRIQYVFECSDSKSELIVESNTNINNMVEHIIRTHIKLSSDNCIDIDIDDETKNKILTIFTNSDSRHTIMFYSDSIPKTRIIVCRILMKLFDVKLSDLDAVFAERYNQAISTKDLDSSHYKPLDNDDLVCLEEQHQQHQHHQQHKDEEKNPETLLPTLINEDSGNNILQTPSETLSQSLSQTLSRSLSQILSQTQNLNLNSNPQINTNTNTNAQTNTQQNQNLSTFRKHDFNHIMSILNGNVNPEVIIEMLNFGVSTSDIINNLTM